MPFDFEKYATYYMNKHSIPELAQKKILDAVNQVRKNEEFKYSVQFNIDTLKEGKTLTMGDRITIVQRLVKQIEEDRRIKDPNIWQKLLNLQSEEPEIFGMNINKKNYIKAISKVG